MALADLNRSNDTPIATLKLSEITPKDWPTLPAVLPAAQPVYVPVISYVGGAVGDDISVATANSTTAYSPKTQAEKASLMVPPGSLAVDIGRRRGSIAPGDPYPKAGDAPLAAPVITTLAPATAAVGDPTLAVLITGTGFTPWSLVKSGNYPIPFQYISPTQLQIVQKPWASVAGTVQVVVTDHGVDSAPKDFVFT